ncbi:methyltransferase [Microbispora sp. RL4-1S]|uniref:Methyltransferase n=1 Tax=Microbispora oryzae TaxID=2806554 RepID=A0A940WNB7_9ACTN|nr:50S ribosomal protein L11 methyltransferase [Microbispora oryzae]MBP2704181.1 methyltransferase [Microbispora oryzae]
MDDVAIPPGPAPDPALAAFVRDHTTLAPVPYVPEIRLRTAARPGTVGAPGRDGTDSTDGTEGELYELWELAGRLPFWAYPWAGGQALARHILDHPELVRGRTVLDVATGSGLVAVAAALAGAAEVTANDVDPNALAATALNARANGVSVRLLPGDLLDRAPGQDVVLAGDVLYERPLAERVIPFLSRPGVALAGVPDRACTHLPPGVATRVATYDVPAVLEDTPTKQTAIYRFIRSIDL